MLNIRKVIGITLAGLITLGMAGTAIANSAPDQTYATPTVIPTSDVEKVATWQDMKFTIFTYQGVYSHYTGWYKGQKQEAGCPEQIKAWGHQQTWGSRIPLSGIPREEYLAIAQTFDAPNFDPTAWCQQTKDTGMRMLLITSKHHDGFAMWDTATTDYNSAKQSPSHRDPILELSQACSQVGTKFGLYFSNIDWEKQPENPWRNDNALSEEGYMNYIHEQLKELLGGKYSEIAEPWYDMGRPNPGQSDKMRQWVHELQPNIMINSRVGSDRVDFEVGWDNELQSEQAQGPWEPAVSIFPKCWGHCEWNNVSAQYLDTRYPDYPDWDHVTNIDNQTWLCTDPNDAAKKTRETLTNLFSTAAPGGQLLFNVGPKFDGSYSEWDISVLKAIGEWNTTHPGVLTNPRPTYFSIEEQDKTMVGDSHIYMSVEKQEEGKTIILRDAGASSIESTTLDGTNQALSCTAEDNNLVTTLPAVPDDFLPVIAVKTTTAPVYVPVGLATVTQGQTTIGSEHLEMFKAPTPRTGETQVITSLTSGNKRAEDVSPRFDTTGFTDSYAKYKAIVGGQKIGGLTTADLAAGVGTFTLETGRTYRVALFYDDPHYALKGSGKNTKVTSVTVSVQTVKEPTSISLDLLSVTLDEKVTFTGKDFTPDATILLTLHSGPVDLGTARVAADGTSAAEVIIPSDTPISDHQLIALDAASDKSVSIPLAAAVLTPSNPPATEPSPQSGTQSSNDGSSPTGLLTHMGSSALPILFGAALVAGAGTFLLLCKRAAHS